MVLALKCLEASDKHAGILIELFDVNLTHDVAQRADDTTEVMDIIEEDNPGGKDVEELVKLFLARFRKTS